MAKRETISAEELAAEVAVATEEPPRLESGMQKPPGLRVTMANNLAGEVAERQEVIPPAASETHPCGLPQLFLSQDSKSRIARYVRQYEYKEQDRMALEITEVERELYKLYRSTIGARAISPDYFVAAARMWRTGNYPIKKQPRCDLRTMKINSL